MKKFGRVINNASLKNYNTYKIDARCKYLIFINDQNKLRDLLDYLNKISVKYFILGNGSNIILPDYYDGVVIKLELNPFFIESNTITVGASYMLNKLANITVKESLKGLEWAAGIPGTVGGSVIGNASCYEESLMPLIIKLEVLDNGVLKTITTNDFNYSYRHTTLKDDKIIILKATFKLDSGNKEELLEIIKDRTKKRVGSQPLEYPSAGSVFKNPEGYFAGKLIEDSGLKGYRLGGAEISEKHANFIINKEDATSQDIKALIKYIRNKVFEKYGINLILEQEIIN
ncbi:MAG: UDP-N-acetylmuramate dehydrogenase [Bacilli bacterium]|nr:UDP-N-acetylmuramate dehydrogenase [Bacilli bacterium]